MVLLSDLRNSRRAKKVKDNAGIPGGRVSGMRLLQELGDPVREGTDFNNAPRLGSLASVELIIDGEVALRPLRVEILRHMAEIKLVILKNMKHICRLMRLIRTVGRGNKILLKNEMTNAIQNLKSYLKHHVSSDDHDALVLSVDILDPQSQIKITDGSQPSLKTRRAIVDDVADGELSRGGPPLEVLKLVGVAHDVDLAEELPVLDDVPPVVEDAFAAGSG